MPATIAHDAVSNSGYQAAQASYSWSHTCTGSSLALYVDVAILSVPGTTVTGITYNSVALAFVGAKSTVSGAGRIESWVLAAPATGANTIAVTLTASVASAGLAVSRTGVDQTNPAKEYVSAQATNVGAADATVDVTTTQVGSWAHAAVATDDAAVTPNQTSRNNVSGGAANSGADEDTNGAVAVGVATMSVTGVGAGATWAIGAFEVPPAATFGQGNFRG